MESAWRNPILGQCRVFKDAVNINHSTEAVGYVLCTRSGVSIYRSNYVEVMSFTNLQYEIQL